MSNNGIFCMVPPHPDLHKKIRMTKQLVKKGVELSQFEDPNVLDLRTYAKIIGRPPRTRAHTLVSPTREFAPVVGTARVLVLLVDFSDNQSTKQQTHFEELLFSQGTHATGSMRDYYHEISYGQLNLIGDVYGWYRAPQPYTYYTNGEYGFGNYPQSVEKLVEDVVQLARVDVNFADYNLDGDGYVDALCIVHSGPGAEATGDADHIWSHRSYVFPPVNVNGVKIRDYTMEPEDGRTGVFSHELGHNFGLPDLYDVDYDSSGIGDWCLMAGGSWNNGGLTPAHMSAWCKVKLGWITPKVIFDAERALSIASSANSPDILKLPVGDPANKEYFLIENRRKEAFDQHLPGEGLLIWHIDENQINNNDQNHFLVALKQADGLIELEKGIDQGDSNDPFPGGTDNRTFTENTNPNSKTYDGSDSQVAVSNISDPGDTMTVTIRVGEEPARRALGDRPAEEVYGVSRKTDAELRNVGITNIAQLAEIDVLALAPSIKQDVLKLFGYKARARVIATFDINAVPFEPIQEWKVGDILKEPITDLVNHTGLPEAVIAEMKDELAKLAASFDGRILKILTFTDVG